MESTTEGTILCQELGSIRCQTSTGSGHLSVNMPARVRDSGSRKARLLSKVYVMEIVMDLAWKVKVLHGI